MPWIHVDDLCAIYLEITNTQMNGAYNAAINDNTTNSVFSDTLRFMGIKSVCPMSQVFDQDDFGEMSKIVLTGRRISSDKLEETGFL
jgi:NAD dependent epimerase/dehydratase family enzyme